MNASIYVYTREYLVDERNWHVCSPRSLPYVMEDLAAVDIDSSWTSNTSSLFKTGAYVPMSAFDLKSKVAVVTGGAGLIGRGLVEGLASAHAQVFVADVDLRAADEFAARLRLDDLSVSSVELDISDYDSISRCVKRSSRRQDHSMSG